MNDQHEPDLELEARLRKMYEKSTPADSGRLKDSLSSFLLRRLSESPRSANRRTFRPLLPAGFALAAAALIAALVVVPLWLPARTGPKPAATQTGSHQPTATTTAVPSAARPSASPPSSPVSQASSDWARMTGASVDDAGPIRSGGLWAVSGTRLMFSFDGGSTWSSSQVPPRDPDALVPATAVYDATRAWTLRAGPGSTTGNSDSVVSLFVYRTSDGGATWRSTQIPGNFFEAFFILTFADADHGFLVAYPNAGSDAVVYRTSDGGATWKAGPKRTLNWAVSVTDATTLWTDWIGPSAMCYDCGKPLLQVSRDAGVTWSNVALPGYAGALTGDLLGAAAPPTFLDPKTGFFAVNQARTDPGRDGTSKIFGTTDGGRTWSLVATAPYWLENLVAVDAGHWFGVAGVADSFSVATDDAGKTWHKVASTFPRFADATCWFTDSEHGAGVLAPGLFNYPAKVLYVTADGGRTWNPAPLGE